MLLNRRVVSLALVFSMATGSMPVLMAAPQSQGAGIISGKANDEAKKPYTDYKVNLRNVVTGAIVSVPLDPQGRFAFNGLALPGRYMVELFSIKANKVVCTAGPYGLSSPSFVSKTDVNVNCGTNPAVWILAAAGGTAAAIALAVRSPKK
jgi:hypothetical protein